MRLTVRRTSRGSQTRMGRSSQTTVSALRSTRSPSLRWYEPSITQPSPASIGSTSARSSSSGVSTQPGPCTSASSSTNGTSRRLASARPNVVFPFPLALARTATRLMRRSIAVALWEDGAPVSRTTTRYVYDFDEPADGGRELLGGKGVGLAEMTQLGVPVPAGFTITTDACRAYSSAGAAPDGLDEEIEEHMARLEGRSGKRFGDPEDPLLVSVRSGAAVSMP